MPFYKKLKKRNNKWYPQATTVGKPVTTKEIAQKLSALSSLSTGDTLSVLDLLGGVMADYMNAGRTVKLNGVGTFYYTANAQGQGVDTPEEVNARQIVGVRVRFIPEVGRNQHGKISTRSLVSSNIFWEEYGDKPTTPTNPDGGGGGDEGGGSLG